MKMLAAKLWNDEHGFLVSAEMVLVSTVLTLGMVVGLSEVSMAVNNELCDVADAFGSVNQSYRYDGLFDHGKGRSNGSRFHDSYESSVDIVCAGATSEW